MRRRLILLLLLACTQLGCLVATDAPPQQAVVNRDGASATIPCPIFPQNNIWNTPIDQLAVDDHTPVYLSNMAPDGHLQAGFNSGRSGMESGIPYVLTNDDTKKYPVTLLEAEESGHLMLPVPEKPPLEQATNGRLIMLDTSTCFLYETLRLRKDPEGQWVASSAAAYDLRSHILPRTGWASADAAGLAIFPGLVRIEEVTAGRINHALRFSTPRTRKLFIWPARHADSNIYDAGFPPMGARFRLKSSFRLNEFSPPMRVILRALQIYGMFLADNGPAWTISGAPDKRWNDAMLAELNRVPASALEMVDEVPLMADANLGIARQDFRIGDLPVKDEPVAKPAPAPAVKQK